MSVHSLTTDAVKVLNLGPPSNPAKALTQRRQTKGKPSVNLTPATGGTPPGSNAPSPNPAYYIGIDWFEATLSGGVIPIEDNDETKPAVNFTRPVPDRDGLISGRVELWHNQRARRNKHYRYGFDVLFIPADAKESENRAAMLDQYRVASLSAVPHKGNNCLERSSIFQADNHILYRADCWKIFDAVFSALGCFVHHLTRLDVALDGHGLISPANEYYREKMEERFGSRENCTIDKVSRATYDTDNWMTDKDGNVTNFYVGSMSSKKVLNGYAKGQRIEIENKQYIREAWRASGLITDDGKDVERLELRLRKEGVDDLHVVDPVTAEIAPLQWERLREPKYLTGAFKASVTGFYGFVRDNGKHRSNWDNIETIDWDLLTAATVVRLPRTKRPSQTWRAKHAVYKVLSDTAVQSYLQDAVTNYVSDQLTTFNPSPSITDNLAWGASLELSAVQETELKRLAGLSVKELALSLTDHLTDTVLPDLPGVMAWAMAKEHNVTEYMARRLRKDMGAKEYSIAIKAKGTLSPEDMEKQFAALNQKLAA